MPLFKLQDIEGDIKRLMLLCLGLLDSYSDVKRNGSEAQTQKSYVQYSQKILGFIADIESSSGDALWTYFKDNHQRITALTEAFRGDFGVGSEGPSQFECSSEQRAAIIETVISGSLAEDITSIRKSQHALSSYLRDKVFVAANINPDKFKLVSMYEEQEQVWFLLETMLQKLSEAIDYQMERQVSLTKNLHITMVFGGDRHTKRIERLTDARQSVEKFMREYIANPQDPNVDNGYIDFVKDKVIGEIAHTLGSKPMSRLKDDLKALAWQDCKCSPFASPSQFNGNIPAK